MRYRWGLAMGLLALLVLGAYSGTRVRTHPRYVTAQAAGTSGSGGAGTGGQPGGDTGTGGRPSDDPPVTSGPSPGADPGGQAGGDTGTGGRPSDDPPDLDPDSALGPEGDGGLSPLSPTGPDDPGEPPPSSGPPISTPSTSTPPPPDDVAEGRPVACPAGTEANIRCFHVDDPDASAVRVPDGQGGTVVVAPPDGPLFGDGFSTSAASNADLRIDVDVRTGIVVHADPRAAVRQAVLATLATLLLLVVLVALGATLVRLQRRAAP